MDRKELIEWNKIVIELGREQVREVGGLVLAHASEMRFTAMLHDYPELYERSGDLILRLAALKKTEP